MPARNRKPSRRPYRREARFPAQMRVSVSRETLDAIEAEADARDMSASQVAREIIAAGLKRRRKP